jgi:hypothetical protein
VASAGNFQHQPGSFMGETDDVAKVLTGNIIDMRRANKSVIICLDASASAERSNRGRGLRGIPRHVRLATYLRGASRMHTTC